MACAELCCASSRNPGRNTNAPNTFMLSFFDASLEYSCSSRIRLEILLDLENLIGSQTEFCRAHDLLRLLSRTHPHNRSGDDWITQRPGNRDLARRAAVTLTDPT